MATRCMWSRIITGGTPQASISATPMAHSRPNRPCTRFSLENCDAKKTTTQAKKKNTQQCQQTTPQVDFFGHFSPSTEIVGSTHFPLLSLAGYTSQGSLIAPGRVSRLDPLNYTYSYLMNLRRFISAKDKSAKRSARSSDSNQASSAS